MEYKTKNELKLSAVAYIKNAEKFQVPILQFYIKSYYNRKNYITCKRPYLISTSNSL